MNNNHLANLKLSTKGFSTVYLVTLSRDSLDWLAIGIIYWQYDSKLSIYWIKEPASSVYSGLTITTISALESQISLNVDYDIGLSIIDLYGSGLLTLS